MKTPFKTLVLAACAMALSNAADLPSKKYLNLAAVKKMVAVAEAEAEKRSVSVTICIMDESGNLLFLQKGERVSINTIEWAQRKARHAALAGTPSKNAADAVQGGNVAGLVYPYWFPAQGGLPIRVDGQLIGAISISGGPTAVDEAIAQTAIDALLK
jgi:glc operon protein GlcG